MTDISEYAWDSDETRKQLDEELIAFYEAKIAAIRSGEVDHNRFRTSDGYTFYRVAVTGQLASQFRARGRRPLIMWCDSRDPSKVDLSFHEDCGGHPIDVGGVRLDGEFG